MKNFCRTLGFIEEDILKIEQVSKSVLRDEEVCRYAQLMTDESTYNDAEKALKILLSDDADGIRMLCALLYAASITEKIYNKRGIPKQILIDTMKCFPRFVDEYKAQYGRFGFDRSFWVGRQLSLKLFRLGELEYEMNAATEEAKEIAMHVPSGCDLTRERVQDSIERAKEFFATYYPQYADADYFITSWLVSSRLKKILSPNSKILGFQSFFELVDEFYSDSYKRWVFGSEALSPDAFKEETTLQRRIKEYVLGGGKMTDATAKLK